MFGHKITVKIALAFDVITTQPPRPLHDDADARHYLAMLVIFHQIISALLFVLNL